MPDVGVDLYMRNKWLDHPLDKLSGRASVTWHVIVTSRRISLDQLQSPALWTIQLKGYHIMNMSYVTSNPGNAEEDAPLVQEGHEEEIFAPKVSLSQIVLGTHMHRLDRREQELVLAMMAGRMAIVDKVRVEFSAEQLNALAEDCDDMAKARITAEKTTPIVPSGEALYAGVTTVTPPSAWGEFGSLDVLDSSSSSQAQVPKLYTDALKHKIFLPLTMFTYDVSVGWKDDASFRW